MGLVTPPRRRGAPPSALVVLALFFAGCSGCSKKDESAPDASAFLASLVDAGDGGSKDGGSDPGAMPAAVDDDLTQRMQHLLEAVSQDNPDLAQDAVFPRDGYVQAKEAPDPQKSYDKTVAGAFKRSIERNNRKLKGVEHAKYVSFELGHQIVQMPSGKHNFKMPLWRVRHSKIKFTIDGKERTLDIAEMTAWRGAWYVTRLR